MTQSNEFFVYPGGWFFFPKSKVKVHLFYYSIYNMSEEKSQNPDELKGSSRRSRKDEKGRNYICGCGKKYLSYPALYTHIKTKHDSQQPEGTKKTGIGSGLRKAKQSFDEKVLKQLLTLTSEENFAILKQLDEEVKGKVPLKKRIREQAVGKEIYEAFSNLNKGLPVNLYKKSSLETVLAVYLLNAGQYLYLKFAKWFRTCYSDHGHEIFDTIDKGYGENKINRTFSHEQCRYTPLIADFFIRFFVPYEQPDTDFIGAIKQICYDFCIWMLQKKLTSMELIKQSYSHNLNKQSLKTKLLKKQLEQRDDSNDDSEEDEGVEESGESMGLDEDIESK